MAVIKFEPSICKEEDSKFKGYLSLDIPNYVQRLKYIKECGFKAGKDGDSVVMGSMNDNIDALVKMIDLAKIHVKEIKLEKGDLVYKKFDELLDDSECDGIINEIAGVILNGVKLGKS